MIDHGEVRSQLLQGVRLLFESGVMQATGHGNASARLPSDRMMITTVPVVSHLTEKDFTVVGLDGRAAEGSLDPAVAEIVHMHARLYVEREDVGSVFHTHSPNLTAFALAHIPLPCHYESMVRHGLSDPIPVAEWAPRGSAESVGNILAEVKKRPGLRAVLLANHGVLAFAKDPAATAQLLIVLEEAARASLAALPLGGTKPLPADAQLREHAQMARFGSDK